MDWTLDVLVAPGLDYHMWKDEDELAEAVRRGVYTAGHAREIREAGERGLYWLRDRRPPLTGHGKTGARRLSGRSQCCRRA